MTKDNPKKSPNISVESLEKIKRELPAVLESSSTMTLLEISFKLGFRGRQTLYHAGKADPEIGQMLNDYLEDREPNINELIKSQWTKRLATGKAHASEYIFFMMNKFPDEFQDRRNLIGAINVSANNHTITAEDVNANDVRAAASIVRRRLGLNPAD